MTDQEVRESLQAPAGRLSSFVTTLLLAGNVVAAMLLLTSLGDLILPRQNGRPEPAPTLFFLLICIAAALIAGSAIGGLSTRQRLATLIVSVVAGSLSVALSLLYFGIFLLDSGSVKTTLVFFAALFTAAGPMLTSAAALMVWRQSERLSRRSIVVITCAIAVLLTNAQIATVIGIRLMVAPV